MAGLQDCTRVSSAEVSFGERPQKKNLFFSPKDQFLLLQVSALTSHCPVIISVEGHQMTVVASDGQEVEPEVV